MSSVLRVKLSNVRMPRSHSITFMLPPARMYSADSSHSSIVAEMPRLSSTGVFEWPSSRSSVKFCMLRAPTCRMSEYFSISSSWLMSITSETSLRLWRSAADAQHAQAFLAEPLEAVRRAARLEGAAAQHLGARAS